MPAVQLNNQQLFNAFRVDHSLNGSFYEAGLTVKISEESADVLWLVVGTLLSIRPREELEP
ncbi:MAG: hypothetical protein J4N78_12100 [Chloroflexi bacterium]|nr:hypothetical protein [Chloroflexota bacterium]